MIHAPHNRSPLPLRRSPLAIALVVVVLLLVAACRTAGPEGEVLPRSASTRSDGPFDVDRPAIARLDPDLLHALQDAARDAQRDGVRLVVTSGWRSRAHQARLLAEAVRKYGSEEEALRYVATPDSSAHVTGDAVDIGPTDGADWLGRHGDAYGLCQTFANEMWHFELATTAGGTCPPMLPDGSSRQ